MLAKNNFRIIHHCLLALTAVFYASTTSLQLFNSWPSWQLLLFLGSATLLAYRIAHWKPVIIRTPFQINLQGKHNKFELSFLVLIVLFTLVQLPFAAIIGALMMGLFSGLYFSQWNIQGKIKSGLRSIPLIKNILLAFVWSATTVWFPAHQSGYVGGEMYLFTSRFIYILAICFAVDLRDLDTDRNQNIKTLPVIYGYQKIKILCVILLLLFLALTILRSSFVEIPFRTIYNDSVLIGSSIITILSLFFLKEKDSYNRYTVLMDGNMFLQSFLLVV